jgi:class 3 adenylate cyclase
MDRHDIPGVTAEQVAQAHLIDLAIASKHDVQFLTYWFDPQAGAAFCLARASSPDEMAAVHAEGHGLVPNIIIPVVEDNVLRFLGRIEDPGGSLASTAFRTILFTDLQGSTSLLNAVGQTAFMLLLTEHDLIIRRALVAAHGREVKHTGDGIMASFDEVGPALTCAIAIQNGFDARNDATTEPALHVRIGMAAGEPVDRGDDLFGATVNLASRICDAAEVGQVLVSEPVQAHGTSLGFAFDKAGVRQLKGFAEPTPVFELHRDRGPLGRPSPV